MNHTKRNNNLAQWPRKLIVTVIIIVVTLLCVLAFDTFLLSQENHFSQNISHALSIVSLGISIIALVHAGQVSKSSAQYNDEMTRCLHKAEVLNEEMTKSLQKIEAHTNDWNRLLNQTFQTEMDILHRVAQNRSAKCFECISEDLEKLNASELKEFKQDIDKYMGQLEELKGENKRLSELVQKQ